MICVVRLSNGSELNFLPYVTFKSFSDFEFSREVGHATPTNTQIVRKHRHSQSSEINELFGKFSRLV
ncbi:hypothetical protein VCRA2119O147_1160007 [Vibrio crassostreae]|uniref:Uncharacterized protein n=1 Tax=Vibrio crassostreae TaxID=246167 RepID=A0ABP1X5J2_9VIBR|nr:hypothetical protein VCRA2119O245_100008 [Vibrio crassostreae]CAK1694375.1 hypothetical protein VCRA2110O173_100022 [Vibrio crassostreae]CAK1721070.1 hypothetical protein VCRA2116O233_120009 [Vibrio crassostreae]CAK1734824.1 hypothetical protein VCRA2119O145_120107 [Vibrio crassostreae]CAK1735737.1 hypothetical protein VCRA2113O206_120135 [Vibrio crassostreae]